MTASAATPVAPQTTAAPWRAPLAWTAAAAGLACTWMGGLPGLAGGAVAAAAAVYALSQRAGATQSAAPATHAATVGRVGAEVMVSQVVPVWSRQMDVTREASNAGLAELLNTFSELSGALGTLTQNLETYNVAAGPGAVDDALREQSPALEELTAASRRAFEQRDAAVKELTNCAEGLTELQLLAKRSREIARHTRLVAFNASIEANRNRSGADAGGAQAVAGELRTVAASLAETAEQIERVVHTMVDAVRRARREGEVRDTSPEELRLEVDLCARKALNTLLGSLGASLQGSSEVRQASSTLREQLDMAFMNFQFGDRVSQMISIIANDMSNFARWVAANPRATQTDAAEWLAALEASYTMDEQRSQHHGNVHVEQSTSVEFF